MPDHLIRDIRFFERPEPEGPWDYLGSSGEVYPVADRGHLFRLGERFALRLAEQGFRTRGYHHVYLVLCPFLEADAFRLPAVQLEPWFLLVEVGLPADQWPAGAAEEQYGFLAGMTERALRNLCRVHEYDPAPVPGVAAEVREQGADLELTRLQKETNSYSVRVTYKISPHPSASPVYVEYEDRRTGRRGKIEALELKDWEDVFPLFASASVAKGTITFRPRESFRAGLSTRNYNIPIQLPVARVLGDEPEGRE